MQRKLLRKLNERYDNLEEDVYDYYLNIDTAEFEMEFINKIIEKGKQEGIFPEEDEEEDEDCESEDCSRPFTIKEKATLRKLGKLIKKDEGK